jgi:hypothetical protein
VSLTKTPEFSITLYFHILRFSTSARKTGHVARRAIIQIGEKTEGKMPLGKPSRRWENNIKTKLKN